MDKKIEASQVEKAETLATWCDDHIMCAKARLTLKGGEERTEGFWWIGWEGLAALKYYNHCDKAKTDAKEMVFDPFNEMLEWDEEELEQ